MRRPDRISQKVCFVLVSAASGSELRSLLIPAFEPNLWQKFEVFVDCGKKTIKINLTRCFFS